MEDVLTPCPDCGEPTEHRVLKATPNNLTAECAQCGHVHTFSPPHLRTVEIQVVLSEGDESQPGRIETPSDEQIGIGDEFEMAGHRCLVTGIELHAEGKKDRAEAAEIKVIQAKVFDQVPLKISVNDGEVTRSHEVAMDPDAPVQVGEVIDVGKRLVCVKTLKSDQNRTLHKGFLLARNIVRAFCDPAPAGTVAGEVVATRRRGRNSRSAGGPSPRIKGPRGQGPKRR